jgi:vacuolar protein sorting-associated protein 16
MASAVSKQQKQKKKGPTTNPFEDDTDPSEEQQHVLQHDPPRRRGGDVLPSASSTLSIDNQSSSVGLNRLASSPTTSFSRNPFDGGGPPPVRAPRDNDADSYYDEDDATHYTGGSSGSVGVVAASGSAGTAGGGAGGGSRLAAGRHTSAAPAEASWQYLGDLPYRRIPIYTNVVWHRNNNEGDSNSSEGGGAMNKGGITNTNERMMVDGLSCVPSAALSSSTHRLSQWEVRQLVATTTRTIVAGCPHGGPIATVTVPAAASKSASTSSPAATLWTTSDIKIMTNSGTELSRIKFPPPPLDSQDLSAARSAPPPHQYVPSDLVTLGFTSRTLLVVVLRDATVLVYNVQGHLVLPPFALVLPPLPTNDSDRPTTGDMAPHVVQAAVYENGVAVLMSNQVSAIAELLDDRDSGAGRGGGGPADPVRAYVRSAASSARLVTATTGSSAAAMSGASLYDAHCSALVTVLPTLAHSRLHHCTYVALCVLPGIRTSSGHPEVLVSTSDNSVVVVNVATLDVTDVNCRTRLASPIVQMSVAPNGRFLAAFTESQMLTVVSTTFETKVLDFDTSEGSAAPPTQLCWCGEDCVMLHWKNLGVLLIGPYGDWVRCAYNEMYSQLYLLPDMDGCRVVTESAVELLQRVPPTTANLLRIGSIEPSAMLLDASDAFFFHHRASSSSKANANAKDRGRHPSDDDDAHPQSVPAASSYVSAEEAAAAIVKTGMLNEAIEACTEAACREFDIVTQKRLLRAASYGMHFGYKNPGDERRLIMGGPGILRGDADDDFDATLLPSPTSAKFVRAARKLRVLNALRHPRVGFVLTSAQYDAITPAGVIARLVENFSRPALAVAVARYLNLPKSVQLYARAAQASALVATLSSSTRSGKPLSDSEIAEAAIRVINNEDGATAMASPTATHSASAALSMAGNYRGGYATVAMAANRVGRKGVANLLLMLETSVSDKVPALISTGAYADAIAVATAARCVSNPSGS